MLLKPTATHKEPFQATLLAAPLPPNPELAKIVSLFVDADQVIPSVEYPNVFVVLAPTTNLVPFQAISLHIPLVNMEFPFVDALQVIPSVE